VEGKILHHVSESHLSPTLGAYGNLRISVGTARKARRPLGNRRKFASNGNFSKGKKEEPGARISLTGCNSIGARRGEKKREASNSPAAKKSEKQKGRPTPRKKRSGEDLGKP